MKAKAKMQEADFIVKILCIGDSGVGKTNILMRFCQNQFTQNYTATIGVDFKVKNVQTDDGKKIKLQIWDTAGQQRYRNINQSYYRRAIGVLLVYSINDRASFQNVENWMKQIHEHAIPKIIKFLIANKTDLEHQRKVTYQQGKRVADKYALSFLETSAKTGNNIEQVFTQLAQKIYNAAQDFDDEIKSVNRGSALKNLRGSQNVQSGCKC